MKTEKLEFIAKIIILIVIAYIGYVLLEHVLINRL